MKIRSIEFHDFQKCMSLLDMLDDTQFVLKYNRELEIKFEEMIEWFIKTKLGIFTRSIPPYTTDNQKLSLLQLYLMVKSNGGYKNVTDNNLWAVVAKDMGYDYTDGEFMRIMYAMYLDVLVYYYKFKIVQEKAMKKEADEDIAGPSVRDQERRRSVSDVQEDDAKQYFALFAGSDWHGMKKLHKRRRFDFGQAARALDEANKSVLKNSSKLN
ncbi:putative transcription factor & chromatin remodeling ARID family [Helianthus anomalus]